MPDYNATAVYFEERAKRARYFNERARLLEAAARYRAKAIATGDVREAKFPERPSIQMSVVVAIAIWSIAAFAGILGLAILTKILTRSVRFKPLRLWSWLRSG